MSHLGLPRLLLFAAVLSLPLPAQLSGVYTVGPGGAFPDLSTAISALVTTGVSAPVQFVVTANQTGSWNIGAFPGQGAGNPVSFAGGGATTLSGTLPILVLNGCANVTFDGFTATLGAGEAVRIDGGASNCVFTRCNFTVPVTTTGATNRVFNIANGVNCRIEDSSFGGGYSAFVSTGGTGCTIQRCRVQGGGWRISENSAPNFTFKNNFVWGNANFGFIVNPGSANLKVHNNSFYIVHTGASSQYCSLRWYSADTTEVLNNAFYNIPIPGQGFIMWCSASFRPTVMDYNVYQLVNGISHVYYSATNHTLATWQAQGFDANSTYADPLYLNTVAAPPDLHVSPASPCAMAGQTIVTVTDDIDGAPRIPAYDIGAHEVTAANLLAATTTGGGTGDLFLTLTVISAGATEGFTLMSFNTAAPVGTGPLLGLYPDGLTWSIFSFAAFPGNPFHFPVGPVGVFPDSPFVLPPGVLASLSGQVSDVVAMVFGGPFYLGRSNVVRLSW